ncbi:hypothetical protein OUZ56_012272 [Daphnia magna]|uniref:Uncharacterized protein n=1 Tax=Daphnia magna TaxID=35525 RepID=A0ABQ9Z2I4_9CRUS|nr:hypothetical protein OUZ56_012272 [Daphnia magna]
MDGQISERFWKSQLVNINGYPNAWEHNETNGDWIKQEATIHTPNVELIAEFEELHLNDFDFALKSHPAHDTMEMEQLNILNDLVGRLQEGETKYLVGVRTGNLYIFLDQVQADLENKMGSNKDRQNLLPNFIKVEEESDSNDGSSSTATIPLGVEKVHESEYNSCTENELHYSASKEECGSNDEYMFQYSPISEKDQQEEEDINRDDISEESLQSPVCSEPTRSCNNCKMNTVTILSYRRAGKIRMENLSTSPTKKWELELRNDLRTSRIHSRILFSEKRRRRDGRGETGRNTKCLLCKRANFVAWDGNGRTFRHNGSTAGIWSRSGYYWGWTNDSTPGCSNEQYTPTMCVKLSPLHITRLNSLGETQLIVEIAVNQRESISFLWETSLISKSGREAETLLHYAAQFTNRNVALGACDSRRRVNINQRSLPRFESALIAAVRYGNPDIVNVLLKNGATNNNPDKEGNYAQDYIKNQQIRRIFRILENA